MSEPDRESGERDEAYLWDRSGEADPLVKRLEGSLAPLRAKPALDPARLPERRRPVVRWLAWGVGGAAMAAACAAAWINMRREPPPVAVPVTATASSVVAEAKPCRAERAAAGDLAYDVAAGDPTCAGARPPPRGFVAQGAWIDTGEGGEVHVGLGSYGHVTLGPRSRLRVVSVEANEHRLELERGHLHAKVVAPPRLFLVQTRSATAIDLGCAYDLDVAASGSGTLKVTDGAVELAPPANTGAPPIALLAPIVPRGAEAAIDALRGPGTPVWSKKPLSVRDALRRFDADPDDERALGDALAGLGPRDTLTLFHLLARVPAGRREEIVKRLEAVVPDAAPHAPSVALLPAALLAWKEALLPRWKTIDEPELGAAPLPNPKAPKVPQPEPPKEPGKAPEPKPTAPPEPPGKAPPPPSAPPMPPTRKGEWGKR